MEQSKKDKIKKFFVPDFDVESVGDDEYKNTNKFSIEKKYDVARIRNQYGPLLMEFSKDHKKYINQLDEYQKSQLKYIREMYDKGAYDNLGNSVIDENCKNVWFLIKKGNKSKKIREKRFNNHAIKYLSVLNSLNFYSKKLNQYKSIRDEGKQNLFIFERGENYSTAEEFKNIKLLLKNTRDYLNLLSRDDSELEKASKWNEFLKNTIDIQTDYMEYNIVLKTIENLPEFTKKELDEIYNHKEHLENLNQKRNVKQEKSLTK